MEVVPTLYIPEFVEVMKLIAYVRMPIPRQSNNQTLSNALVSKSEDTFLTKRFKEMQEQTTYNGEFTRLLIA